jgi:hypothetical protein
VILAVETAAGCGAAAVEVARVVVAVVAVGVFVC